MSHVVRYTDNMILCVSQYKVQLCYSYGLHIIESFHCDRIIEL